MFGLVGRAAVVGGAMLVSGCAGGAQGSTGQHPYRDSIVVVGVGKAHGKPDVARINIGIEARSPTVAEATKQNAEQMNRLLSTVKGAGIADKDIRTSNFSVHFERNDFPGPPPYPMPVPAPAPDGPSKRPVPPSAPSPVTPAPPRTSPPPGHYRVANTVQITVRDLGRVASVLDSAIASGANNVWGVIFEIENMAPVESQIRASAVADAKARAAELAKLHNLQLGEVVSVSEVMGRTNPPPAPMPMSMSADARTSTPIESGELTLQGQIEVTYAIKK